MDGMLTADQVTDLVRTAVADAVKAINTVDPASRPGTPAPITAPNINLRRPVRPSFARAIGAARKGNWRGAELERDLFQITAAKYGGDPDAAEDEAPTGNRFWVPSTPFAYFDVLEEAAVKTEATALVNQFAMKAMGEQGAANAVNAVTYASTSVGAQLVPIQFLQDEFVLALTSTVVVMAMPEVRTIPVVSNVIELPRETTAATASTAQEAAALSSADPAFGTQSFTIKKQYGYRTFSNELLRDSNPAIDQYVARTLVRDIALFRDSQYLEGSGSGANLTGLRNYSSLTTSSWTAATNGSQPGYDDLVKMVFDIRKANTEMTAWIMHPRTLQNIMLLKDTIGRPIFQEYGSVPRLNPGAGTTFTYPSKAVGSLLGFPVYLSTQVLTNETQGSSGAASHIIYGNFNFAAILERQALEIAVSEHVAFANDQTAVRGIARSALALTQPTAFAVATGII